MGSEMCIRDSENSDSLEPAAEETGLEVKTSDWIDSTTTEGIGTNRQVLAAALSDDVLNSGLNSETVELGDYHSMVLRTLEHEPPAPKPLEEVKEDILSNIQTERATEQLNELSDKVVDELASGGNATDIAQANEAEYHDTVAVGRTGSELDGELVRTVFTMPKPADGTAAYRKVTLSDGNLAVAIFSGVETRSAEELAAADDTPASDDPADNAPANNAPVNDEAPAGETPVAGPGGAQAPVVSMGPTEFQSLVTAIEQRSKIVRNDALLGGEGQNRGRGQY